jgi:hypothetical protein
MTTADQADTAARSSTSRTVRCAVYGVISVIALVATWGANLDYTFDGFMHNFMNDLKVTPASRSYTGDLVMLALAAVILMVVEARKHGIKFVWLYILGGFAIAISVTFPLFLIARELRINPTDTARIRTTDVILLAVVGALAAAQLIWVDVV